MCETTKTVFGWKPGVMNETSQAWYSKQLLVQLLSLLIYLKNTENINDPLTIIPPYYHP